MDACADLSSQLLHHLRGFGSACLLEIKRHKQGLGRKFRVKRHKQTHHSLRRGAASPGRRSKSKSKSKSSNRGGR